MKNTENFPLQRGNHHVKPPNDTFLLSAKMNGTQRRINPLALAIAKLHWSEGTRQARS